MAQRPLRFLAQLAVTPEVASRVDELKANLQVFYGVGGKILSYGAARNITAAMNVLLMDCQPAADAVIRNLNDLHAVYTAQAEGNVSEIRAQNAAATRMTIFTIFASLLLLAFLVAYVLRTIISPIVNIKVEMSKIAIGDLTSAFIPLSSKGEIGVLSRATKDALVNLRLLISRANEGAMVVADKAISIEKAVREMAQGNASQSTITNEILHSLEQLSAATQEIAANSQTAANAGAKANLVATQGSEKIANFIDALTKVQDSVSALSSVSKQISSIVETIDDVSDQTNLLALNAAIEAARAGEQGRGFAVVADAVRRLAEQSMAATKEISKLVADIRLRLDQAVNTSNQGALGAQATQDAIDAILAQINGMANMIEGISAAGEEQAASATEVTASMQNLNAIAREVAAASQVSMSAAQNLKSVSQELAKCAIPLLMDNQNPCYACIRRGETNEEEALQCRIQATGRVQSQPRSRVYPGHSKRSRYIGDLTQRLDCASGEAS